MPGGARIPWDYPASMSGGAKSPPPSPYNMRGGTRGNPQALSPAHLEVPIVPQHPPCMLGGAVRPQRTHTPTCLEVPVPLPPNPPCMLGQARSPPSPLPHAWRCCKTPKMGRRDRGAGWSVRGCPQDCRARAGPPFHLPPPCNGRAPPFICHPPGGARAKGHFGLATHGDNMGVPRWL